MIRPARRDDLGAMVSLIRELADYEGGLHQVEVAENHLEAALFCQSPRVFAHVADHEGDVVGMAVWFLTFSTWTGTHGIYVEDLVIRSGFRGSGFGRALLGELARIALASGYARLEWSVLDWNQPAIGFYHHLGSRPMDGWTTHRVSGTALEQLASQ